MKRLSARQRKYLQKVDQWDDELWLVDLDKLKNSDSPNKYKGSTFESWLEEESIIIDKIPFRRLLNYKGRKLLVKFYIDIPPIY